MGELGFLGIRYPEAHGGAGVDTLATVIFAEELSRSGCGGFAITTLAHTDMASPHLANAGTRGRSLHVSIDLHHDIEKLLKGESPGLAILERGNLRLRQIKEFV